MKDVLKEQPILAFPIPSGVIMARMDPNTGAILGWDEPGGTVAAFSGSLPNPPPESMSVVEALPPRSDPKVEPQLDNAVKSVFGRFKKSMISIKDRIFKRN
jgi:hypothetical protein